MCFATNISIPGYTRRRCNDSMGEPTCSGFQFGCSPPATAMGGGPCGGARPRAIATAAWPGGSGGGRGAAGARGSCRDAAGSSCFSCLRSSRRASVSSAKHQYISATCVPFQSDFHADTGSQHSLHSFNPHSLHKKTQDGRALR